MTNPHRRNRGQSPEHRKSMKDIHLGIEKQNRLEQVQRISKLKQKLAFDFMGDRPRDNANINRKGSDTLHLGGVDASKPNKTLLKFPFVTPGGNRNNPITPKNNKLMDDKKATTERVKSVHDLGRLKKINPPPRKKFAMIKQMLAGFGRPPQRVLDAFKAHKKEATKSFVSDGRKLLFNGNEVARHTRNGIEVSYAGFPTAMTSATIRGLGIDTRTVKGVTTINGQRIDPTKTDFHLVPTKNISDKPFRVGTPTKVITPENRIMIDDQEKFRKKVQLKETGVPGRIAEDTTVIQPRDQKFINNITGVKSEIPDKTLGTDTHHILPKKTFPGLRTNVNNGLPLSRFQHRDLHRLNAKLQKMAVKLRAFTNSSSFVGNMRYDQEEQSITGLLLGKHYKWCGVPERTFDGWQGAGSAGAYFNRAIKGQFDCGSGGILTKVQSKISKLKATLNSKNHVKEGMIQLAKNQSADSIINAFITYSRENPNSLGSGVYDPIENRILDARIPLDAIRLQRLFETGTNKLGLNSITDTRQSPATDVELIRSQLKEIEQAGGIPALGFDEGSLEALDVVTNTTDDEILTSLRDSQRSTGILDADLTFRIVDSPKFRRN